MNKTAMQEWYDELTSLLPINDAVRMHFESKIQNYLLKEKKQITDACWYGHDIKHEYFNPIHYFDQTYNQP